jgi:2-polyprenyl-3-methyl-5-hydroxy-6-metoxy-1,4-benzoquinol methylase
MIIKINSTNKHLLDVLYKNPNTDFGLYAKALKNGVIIGNAIDAYNYEVIFQDTKYSFLPEESNSIDFQSYCNPLVVLHIVSDMFGHMLKERQAYKAAEISWLEKTNEQIDTEIVTITIPSFYIHSSWYRDGVFILEKYFQGIKVTHRVGKIFELEIKGNTAFDAINLLALTSLLTHITNEYGIYTWIDEAFATKYARILTNLEKVPYFVFYLYIKRTIRSPKHFDLLKPLFEAYLNKQGLEAELSFYGTHQERIKYITNMLENDISIIDIGCGELQYFKRIAKNGFTQNYFAIDSDDNVINLAKHIAKRYDADRLHLFSSVEDCTTQELVNIIITEVIEHNTPEDAKALLNRALQYNFNKIIITTPNVSFNQFYAENAGKRHDDHHFEWNEKEFENFIENCTQDFKDVTYKLEQIGDKINGIQPTQTAIITKIK